MNVISYNRPARKKPYQIEWRTNDGKRQYESFTTAGSRDTRVADLRRQMSEAEFEAPLSAEQVREYWDFKKAVGSTPWIDVVIGWKNSLFDRTGCGTGLTVADATITYLADAQARLARGQLAAATVTQMKRKSNLFAASFGGMTVASVTPKQIEEWIDDLGFESPVTFNDYRKHVSGLFAHFPDEAKFNPAQRVEVRENAEEKNNVLSVADTAKLFAYALKHYPESLGRLALEAFSGLRFSSAFRLEKSEINFKERGILLPKHKIKTRRRRYIDQLPDNLWLWLAKTNDACWAMESSDWMHLKSKLFTEAEVPHPRNCLRHSFCTYHVAAFKDPGRTATILCHTDQQKLWDTYNGIATNADGLAYFQIAPSSV